MPDTVGPQRPGDRRGWLVFDHLPDDLQAAEDSTQAADHARLSDGLTGTFFRTATNAERELLTHVGYAVPAQLLTCVRWISHGVRNRRWPTLENGS